MSAQHNERLQEDDAKHRVAQQGRALKDMADISRRETDTAHQLDRE